MQKYEHVLKLMQQKGGGVDVNDPDLVALLGDLPHKLPTYIWYIRSVAHLEVKGIRNTDPVKGNGRKVVRYELVAVASPETTATASPNV
jgi:hypothetical protein